MDSERGDMGELNMIMEKVIIIACRTFIKMPAHMDDEFTDGPDGLPHVPLLAVRLVMVLISVNSCSMCAAILIKVRQVILITFSMIMMDSPMSPYSLSTC